MKIANLVSKMRRRSLRARRAMLGAAFLLIAGLLSASIFATGPDPQPEVRTEKAWPVSTLAIEPADLSPSFSAFGRVESSHLAHLRTDLNAQIQEVHVKEGEWVHAGQLLITLDDRETRLELAQRRANLAELDATLRSIEVEQELVAQSTEHFTSMRRIARQKLERHQNLMNERLISQSLLDEVTAQANQAEISYQAHQQALADFPNRIAAKQAGVARAAALLEDAELNLEKTRVLAPFSGPILNVLVAPGDRSGLGTALIDIADAMGFEVRVQVPDEYGERFYRRLEAQTTISAITDGGINIPLLRLSSQVRAGQSGLDAFFGLTVESGAPTTALGRMIELTVTLPEETGVVAVPIQSLYENDRIYAVKAHRLKAIRVERVGELVNEAGEYRVLVRSPELTAGEEIITTQLPRAISGLLVEPA
jgi:multidrug efflux pump subunit AcrA (membrane-fusion protein)